MINIQEIKDALRSAISVKEGVHATSRVLFLDSISKVAMEYVNRAEEGEELFEMNNLIDAFRHHATFVVNKMGYKYHGGEHGDTKQMFSFSNAYAYSHQEKNGKLEIESISKYDLAHFLCDHFDTEEKCEHFIEWVCESQVRISNILHIVCGSRLAHLCITAMEEKEKEQQTSVD